MEAQGNTSRCESVTSGPKVKRMERIKRHLDAFDVEMESLEAAMYF